jgi:hypothetical protein
MQPVQLSLIPDQGPGPAQDLIGALPPERVSEATKILASMIAKAAVARMPEAGDE